MDYYDVIMSELAQEFNCTSSEIEDVLEFCEFFCANAQED